MKKTIVYQLNPNFVQERHLHNICSIATKLYNTANYERRKQWDDTGKIPNYYTQNSSLRANHWYKLLSSQTAQAYTSQTCSICNDRNKSNRKHRGLYACKKCNNIMNADVNGATNILKKYLRDFLSRSSCIVAMPSVVRINNICPS